MRSCSYEEIRSYLLAVARPPTQKTDWGVRVQGNARRFRRTLELVPPGREIAAWKSGACLTRSRYS
jgi:hypothetical protein